MKILREALKFLLCLKKNIPRSHCKLVYSDILIWSKPFSSNMSQNDVTVLNIFTLTRLKICSCGMHYYSLTRTLVLSSLESASTKYIESRTFSVELLIETAYGLHIEDDISSMRCVITYGAIKCFTSIYSFSKNPTRNGLTILTQIGAADH